MASEDRFGFEWGYYSEIDPNYEIQFRRWIGPLGEEDFRGKEVLDAGCGMGRNSFWPLKWGAKRLVAFDFDRRTVEAASRNLQEFAQAKAIYQSIYEIDYEDQFDITFSIGVIHHLENPKKALANLLKATKPGGRVLVWVYSYDGNEWIVRLIDPIRKAITSKLPVRIVHFFSYFASIPLWIFIKTLRGPTPYLRQLSKFSFKHVHSIVFDQMIPKVANYWKRQEVVDLFEGLPIQNLEVIKPENMMGWTAIATKL